MTLNIDYDKALDFGHCESMVEAAKKLSILTNILNQVISVRQKTKKDILNHCSEYPEYQMHKLSWDNKLVALRGAARSDEINQLIDLYQEAEEAYMKIRNKQNQVTEDLMALKKIADVTPR